MVGEDLLVHAMAGSGQLSIEPPNVAAGCLTDRLTGGVVDLGHPLHVLWVVPRIAAAPDKCLPG